MKYTVFLAIIGYTTALNLLGRTQSVAIRGKLTCLGKPAAGVKVKLYDADTNLLGVIDTDDLMDYGKTDSKGEYVLSGSTKEFTTIEPYLAIYHDCNDGIKPCQRTLRVGIPSNYITSDEIPKSIFEAGQLELAGPHPNEGRSCSNR